MADVLDSESLRARAADVGAELPSESVLDRRSTPRKKLSIEVSADLHRRILMICATRQLPVNQAVREVLERAFPAS